MIYKRLIVISGLIFLYATIDFSMQASNMTATQTSATPDTSHDSNIQLLTDETKRLQESVDRWNIGYIVAICIAIVVGISTAFVQWKTISVSKILAVSQSMLDSEKDRKSRDELGIRDIKIAELNESNARINERAGKLEVQAESLKSDAERSRSLIASAQAEVAKASAKAESFRLDIAKANESAKQAEARAAEATLELHRLRTPRQIPADFRGVMIDALKKFPGTPFDLMVASDPEAVDLMSSVRSILTEAKWDQKPHADPISLGGVEPRVGITLSGGVIVEFSASKLTEWGPAIGALVELLKATGIPAEGHAVASGMPTDVVHISIGKRQ